MRLLVAAVLLSSSPLAASAQTDSALQDRVKALEDRVRSLDLAPSAPPTTAHQASGGSYAAFNPSIGLAIDAALRTENDKANALLRAAELNLGAPIDPHLKGWAILNGNAAEVSLEEAALQTTSLPWNLTVTGGRLFASFGRLAHFHDHELPVIDRPRSLDAFVGGETQADGVELSHLFTTPFYLRGFVGAFNKIGGDNARRVNGTARPFDEFTYLARLETNAEFGSDHSADLGVSSAWTPKRRMEEDIAKTASAAPAVNTVKSTWRTLSGVDLTYRWHPASGGLYSGLLWGTEVLVNDERRFDDNRLPTDRVRSFAGYSFVQAKLGRRWRPGVMVDVTEDLDNARRVNRTVSAFLTYAVTEYQRLRLAASQTTVNVDAIPNNHTIALQWTGILGYHVHGFRDR